VKSVNGGCAGAWTVFHGGSRTGETLRNRDVFQLAMMDVDVPPFDGLDEHNLRQAQDDNNMLVYVLWRICKDALNKSQFNSLDVIEKHGMNDLRPLLALGKYDEVRESVLERICPR
jgi:hypothetical protein